MRIRTNLKVVSGCLDIAPLVDVIFLLLIFFMLSSSLVFQPGIPVELPKSKTISMSAAEKIVITITRSNLLFFNDNPVEWENLEGQLSELAYSSKMALAKRRPGEEPGHYSPKVVLRADTHVPYEKIVEVMDLARSLNLGVYLATDAPRKKHRGMRQLLREGN
jgi:biopolymer transport protein ExbD